MMKGILDRVGHYLRLDSSQTLELGQGFGWKQFIWKVVPKSMVKQWGSKTKEESL